MPCMDKPPKKSTGREITEKAIEGGLGIVPFVGSPLAAAFAFRGRHVVQSPHGRLAGRPG
jgi:hypothetical protein